MELEFIILDLAQQNRVSHIRDVILLNSFENVLINEIIWVLVLFWKKSLKSLSLCPSTDCAVNIHEWEERQSNKNALHNPQNQKFQGNNRKKNHKENKT